MALLLLPPEDISHPLSSLSKSFLESKVKHSVLLSPHLWEVQPLVPRFILERKQSFTRPSVGFKMKDTEVKKNQGGGWDSSQGWGMRKGGESGQTEGKEQPWRVWLEETWQLPSRGGWAPFWFVCPVCNMEVLQSSFQTDLGSVAATCIRGGWQDSRTDPEFQDRQWQIFISLLKFPTFSERGITSASTFHPGVFLHVHILFLDGILWERKVLQEDGRASTKSDHIGLNVTFSGNQTQWLEGVCPPPHHFQISSFPPYLLSYTHERAHSSYLLPSSCDGFWGNKPALLAPG